MTPDPFNYRLGTQFSHGRRFRYTLERSWEPAAEPSPNTKKRVGFIMLNPSTADEFKLDPTVRRCSKYAMRWGYGGFIVGNVFAYRSTDPKALYVEVKRTDIVGPENDDYLIKIAEACELIICAWGAHAALNGRDQHVLKLLCAVGFGDKLHYFKLTKGGAPGHPLYLRANLIPIKWEMRGANG